MPRFQLGGLQIPANSTKDFTIPVMPLPLGSQVEIAPLAPLDASWAGIVWTKWVSAINQLTVRLANVTAAPITPRSRRTSHSEDFRIRRSEECGLLRRRIFSMATTATSLTDKQLEAGCWCHLPGNLGNCGGKVPPCN